MSYADKLRDPRWQRTRLESLQRANWTCQVCLCKEKHLNVHHKAYIKGKDPWDYAAEQLLVVCDDCHESQHQAIEEMNEALSWAWQDVAQMTCLIKGFNSSPYGASLLDDLSSTLRAADGGYRERLSTVEREPSEFVLVALGLLAREVSCLPIHRLERILECADTQLREEFESSSGTEAT